ncbi:MAG TPA: MFS transporter, partial [Bacteroidota bacterium]
MTDTTVGAAAPVRKTVRSPWSWVPSLYFAEGVPYVVVITVSVIMYKRLGISNTDNALYTSLLYLPWVLKPLWSPLVDMFGTKRRWVVSFEFIIAVGLAGVAFVLPLPLFFQLTLGVFWLMAFGSATHDIAADGFYMLGLDQHRQVAFVGIRSTFYRVAMISGQGLLVVLAGYLEERSGGHLALAWAITFAVLSGVFFCLFVYHRFILPYPPADHPSGAAAS